MKRGSSGGTAHPTPAPKAARIDGGSSSAAAELSVAAPLGPPAEAAAAAEAALLSRAASVAHDAALPRVSVIVPAHNPGAAWLDECLGSVLAQTYGGAIEVSIFDDASDDASNGGGGGGGGASTQAMQRWAALFNSGRAGPRFSAVCRGSRWGGGPVPAAAAAPPRSPAAAGASAHGADEVVVAAAAAAAAALPTSSAGPAPAGGIGFSKNSAVRQSSGSLLVFLDADDVMLPGRVAKQAAALRAHPLAIAGCTWRRTPAGSSAYWERWANGLSSRQLWLQQYREVTLPMPTWAMARAAFERVGGFEERPPASGEAEDLRFFLRHCELHEEGAGEEEEAAAATAAVPLLLVRASSAEDTAGAGGGAGDDGDGGGGAEGAEDATDALLLYRWSPGSGCSRVHRRQLLRIRAAAFERRVLSSPSWRDPGFTIWGAGRDGRNFLNELSAEARSRVLAMCDVDPKKVGTRYTNWRATPPIDVPVVHFSEAKGPVVVCVSLRRGTEQQSARGGQQQQQQQQAGDGAARSDGCPGSGDLLQNVSSLNLQEGRDLWFFT